VIRVTAATLDTVDARYAEVLALTPHGRHLVATPGLAQPLQEEYRAARFVTVEDVLPAEPFAALVTGLLPMLTSVAEQVVMRHAPNPDHTLSDGFRFARVDPDRTSHPATRAKLREFLRRLGLLEFASQLASQLTPLIRFIAGPVSFRRVYFYVYREGDYISVHDDHQVGDRVDVQFPVSLGTNAGLRVLEGGYLGMHYDGCGSMNVLGPCVWHDVPPILRDSSGAEPVRFNMGFRFTPET
jgi:hypothetical protein